MVQLQDYVMAVALPLSSVFVLLAALFAAGIVGFMIMRQRMEKALRWAQAETEVLISSIPSILIGVSSGGLTTYWNAVAETTLGVAAAHVVNQPLSTCDIPWDSAAVLAGIAECRTAARPIRLDNVRFQRPHGQEGCLGFTVVPIRVENGRSLDLLLFGADITERRLTEVTLRRQTGLTRLLQLVAIAANEARTLEEALKTCVDHVCASTSWPIGYAYVTSATGDLVPTNIWHLNNPEQYEAFLKATYTMRFAPGVGLPGQVLATKKPVWSLDMTRNPNVLQTAAAKDLEIQAAFAFPVLVGEEVVAVLEFFALEARELDAQLLETMANIGTQLGRVVERKRAEEELRVANRRLKELASLKDEFVAKASHELRTPLTSIKEGLNLLIDKALGPTTSEQQDFLQTMDQDIDRLAELINNMLDISQIEAGRMRLARVRTDIHELINSLMRNYRPILGHRTVRHGQKPVPPVFVDRDRIAQVLSNLFSNAVKFTPDEGAITIQVEQSDGMVSVAVADNGSGIASEDLPKLFQKFSQVGPQGAGRPRGTGLGLVICKELTELHGGRIDVASEVGRGTTFSVWLPVYTDALALRESVRELLDSASADEGQTVGLIAIQTDSLLAVGSGLDQQRESLQRMADDIKRHVHRGDIVLAIDPSWIVVLAITDAMRIQAIVKRLRGTLRDGEHLRFGAAVDSSDGADAAALFERATQILDQGVAGQAHDAAERNEGSRG